MVPHALRDTPTNCAACHGGSISGAPVEPIGTNMFSRIASRTTRGCGGKPSIWPLPYKNGVSFKLADQSH